jgi:hypothetical protein
MKPNNPIYAPHEVVGQVILEHSMNGQVCHEPWFVLEFPSGKRIYHCYKCRVGVFPSATEMYEKLALAGPSGEAGT